MSNQPDKAVLTKTEEQWVARSRAQDLKPKTMKYRKAEIEFFCGAMAALTAQGFDMPVGWTMCLMTGRPVVEV